MIPESPIPVTINYAPQGTRCPLTTEQAQRGLVPLGCIPAQTWNMLWYETNEAMRCVKYAADTLMCEINTVLTCAGVTACAECTNQFYQALDGIIRAVGTAERAGSVKSSSTPGMVSIDSTGLMTVNCVGNASQLNTACHEIVGAINELDTTYNSAFSNLSTGAGCTGVEKAPKNHASNSTVYGVGTASLYGHLKISDVSNAYVGDAAAGVASSQALLYNAYYITTHKAPLSNRTPNGVYDTVPAGWSGNVSEAARADHVHSRNFSWVAYTQAVASSTGPSYVFQGCQCCFYSSSLPHMTGWPVDVMKSIMVPVNSYTWACGWASLYEVIRRCLSNCSLSLCMCVCFAKMPAKYALLHPASICTHYTSGLNLCTCCWRAVIANASDCLMSCVCLCSCEVFGDQLLCLNSHLASGYGAHIYTGALRAI